MPIHTKPLSSDSLRGANVEWGRDLRERGVGNEGLSQLGNETGNTGNKYSNKGTSPVSYRVILIVQIIFKTFHLNLFNKGRLTPRKRYFF